MSFKQNFRQHPLIWVGVILWVIGMTLNGFPLLRLSPDWFVEAVTAGPRPGDKILGVILGILWTIGLSAYYFGIAFIAVGLGLLLQSRHAKTSDPDKLSAEGSRE